jgi:hypothetical protein
MLAELAISLRDDLRPHIPELLPRLVALFVEAERNSSFDMVKPALAALEVCWWQECITGVYVLGVTRVWQLVKRHLAWEEFTGVH